MVKADQLFTDQLFKDLLNYIGVKIRWSARIQEDFLFVLFYCYSG
jgi:hypothetical protein